MIVSLDTRPKEEVHSPKPKVVADGRDVAAWLRRALKHDVERARAVNEVNPEVEDK